MRYRSVALPPEHGGWGLLFEPILIGLVAAPSRAGLLLAVAAVAVFLARQPLKVLLTDRLAGRRVPRTTHAAWFAAAYLSIAVAAGLLAFRVVGRPLLVPLACAAPLALVQLAFDARNRSRGLLPEVCGAAALAVTPCMLALAEGWHPRFAWALWAIAAARTVPAMVTVRTRVMRLHEPAHVDGADRAPRPSGTPPLIAHATAMATVYALQASGLAARGVLALLSILAARAGFTLRASAPRVRAQRIGIEELIVGLGSALALGWLSHR